MPSKPGSSGRSIPGYNIRVVNERGIPYGDDEIGELEVRGESLMLGYWNQLQKTRQAIYGNMMRTGDKYKCDRGLPISIYRPGRISGHSKTGFCDSNDHIYRIIKGCIQLGTIPNLDIQFNLSFCDYVSQAIVYLSKQSESLSKAFHLRNPQSLSLQ